jgi:Ca2+-transporting ATPase
LANQFKKVATLDFTSERKTMSTVVTGFYGNGNSVLIKGAPERVIDKCRTYKTKDGVMRDFSQEDKKSLITQV